MADSQSIDQLRDTDPTHPRILPESVADRYASNTLDFPKYQTSDGDSTIHNGTPLWSYALSPDGTWNQLTKQQQYRYVRHDEPERGSVDDHRRSQERHQ